VKGYLFTWVLVALGTFGAFKSPLIALAVYVAFAILRPHFLWGFAGDLSGISDLVGVALVLGWLIHGLGSWQFGRARPVVAALLAFSLWAVISATMAAHGTIAWGWVTSLFKFVVPFLVGVTMIRSEEWAKRMLWILVASQGFVAYEFNIAYLQGFNRVRDYGFGGMDNNSVGIGLVTTLGPALALAVMSKRWLGRGLALFAAACILHGALLTFSRGAMVGLIAVAVTAIAILPKRPKPLAVVAIAIALALRLTGPELMARFETAFVEQEQLDGSAAGRIDLWRDCLTVALANPIFGIGPNHWPVVAESFGWTPFKSAHSVWMQTMAELGFFGVAWLALFFVLTFTALWPLARNRSPARADRDRAAMATAVMLAVVGYTVSGQFVSLTGLEIPYYFVMVGVALVVTAPAPVRQTATSPAATAPASRTAPPPIAVPARQAAPARPGPRAGPRRFLPDDVALRTAPESRFPRE
jgi:O-antigen ligase